MEVSGIISGIVTIPQTQQVNPEVAEEPEVPVVEVQEPPVIAETEPPEEESEKIPGVIRNLLKGHFKGVSDLRLRIVHAEKLQALEEAKLEEALENETGFMGDFDAKLSELLAFADAPDPAAVPEIVEVPVAVAVGEGVEVPDAVTVPESVDAVDPLPLPVDPEVLTADQQLYAGLASEQIAGLLELENPSKGQVLGMIGELETTVGNLLISLGAPAAEPVEAPIAGEAVEGVEGVVDPLPVDPPSELDILIASFVDVLIPDFLTSLSEFSSNLGESVLPELSEPRGNGKAYEKFLAMYNDMQDAGEPVEEPDALDIIA